MTNEEHGRIIAAMELLMDLGEDSDREIWNEGQAGYEAIEGLQAIIDSNPRLSDPLAGIAERLERKECPECGTKRDHGDSQPCRCKTLRPYPGPKPTN